MRERPLLFSSPMVRAILEGRKTQTRRVVKPQFGPDAEPEEMCATTPEGWQTSGHSGRWWDAAKGDDGKAIRCPYGLPGDRLWVRETHALRNRYRNVWCIYAADGHRQAVPAPELVSISKPGMRPSIHMPRWASRITLKITGVRVERLKDISEADAMAEGIQMPDGTPTPPEWWSYRQEFSHLWNELHGSGSWAANPWVWAIDFKRINL